MTNETQESEPANLKPETIVPCPYCKAPRGKACRTTIGDLPMRLTHRGRQGAYRSSQTRHNAVFDAMRRGV